MIDELELAAGRSVSRETFGSIEKYAELLRTGATRQNLISTATLPLLWERHILDSAQMVRFEPKEGAAWLDIGSGAGLPGVVIALLVTGKVTLVEPRRLRAEFLQDCVAQLGLTGRVVVVPTKVERLGGTFDVVTARALAALARLLEISAHLSTGKTCWILPKGRSAQSELAEARQAWQGTFHVEQSITDQDSQIIIATGVREKFR